jgi:diamine N-acetyltransferase
VSEGSGQDAIRIVPIDKRNWEEAANLQILPEQADFLTPNVFSIAESKFYPELQPCAIYAGPALVGFLMYGRDPEDSQYWIYRFMIDRRYQRRGYGHRAMRLLIELIRALPNAPEINIAYDIGNDAARQLYRGVGFVEGGIAPWGEQTARLSLTHEDEPRDGTEPYMRS